MTIAIHTDADNKFPLDAPDTTVDVRETFGLDVDMQVPAFSQRDEHVPEVDPTYQFDFETTLAILAGFSHNRRVMVQEIGRASCRERV